MSEEQEAKEETSIIVSKMDLLEKAKAEFNREKRLVIKNLAFNTTDKVTLLHNKFWSFVTISFTVFS